MTHPGNLSEHGINYRFGPCHQPQLQKVVQDIKKNDGSLLDKLKSRFTSKSTPKLPARDYQGLSGSDVDGDEQWSDAEFDTYEDMEDSDDDYEPPPNSHRVFTPPPSASYQRGEYVDSLRDRPDQPPRKPLRPAKNTKPLPPAPSQMSDEEDYINPDGGNDGYIDPTEKSLSNPPIRHTNRAVLTFVSKPAPELPPSPDVYEVPDQEESSSLENRMPPVPPKPSRPLPRIQNPRMDIRQSPLPVHEPLDVEYEVCDTNDRPSLRPVKDRPPFALKPSRDLPPKPSFRAKPELMDREDGPLLPTRNDNPKLPAKPSITDFKRPKFPIPHFLSPNRPPDKVSSVSNENAGSIDTEKEDLYRKPWYAGDCDRKTAEDALIWSNKDGSFLVRQSSGQDIQQPYTLVVLYNDRVYNIPVRFIPATLQYALGREKKGEELFSSVSHMIESHQRNPLVLIDTQSHNKDSTKLLYAVRP